MRGVVFLGERKRELREFPDPSPGPGEAPVDPGSYYPGCYSKVATPRGTEYFSHQTQSSV